MASNRCDRYRNAFRLAKRIKWHSCGHMGVCLCVRDCHHIRSLNGEVLYNVITMHWPVKLTPYCRTVHFQNDKWHLLFYFMIEMANMRNPHTRREHDNWHTGQSHHFRQSTSLIKSSAFVMQFSVLSANCIRRPLLPSHSLSTENDSVRNAIHPIHISQSSVFHDWENSYFIRFWP